MSVRVSEIFTSFQGEGQFTGMPTIFVRFFGCNLECNGFGQSDPTDQRNWVIPYKDIDAGKYHSLKDLPVFQTGCDSSYSWASKFKHLVSDWDERVLAQEILRLGKSGFGFDLPSDLGHHSWVHPVTKTLVQLCFTGGEPMLRQKQMDLITGELATLNAFPALVTIETNATKMIKDELLVADHIHLACSPKLYSVSGERDAIKPDVIQQYIEVADGGVIKFVHNGSNLAWDELDATMKTLGPMIEGANWSVFVMPVGSRLDEQSSEWVRPIVEQSLARGYNISMRSHVYAFGNCIGT